MATGYFSRVFDTAISGNALLSALTGEDVKALEFHAANSASRDLIPDDTNISVEHVVQAAISQQQVYPPDAAADYTIYLGTDSSTQAAAYISLFNLRTDIDTRVLKFINGGTLDTIDTLTKNINLATKEQTYTKVKITDGATDVTKTPGLVLFNSGDNSKNVGYVRDILVWAEDITSGSEIIVFNASAVI